MVCRGVSNPTHKSVVTFGPKKHKKFTPVSPQVNIFLFAHWISKYHVQVDHSDQF